MSFTLHKIVYHHNAVLQHIDITEFLLHICWLYFLIVLLLTCYCMLPCAALISCHFCAWPSGNCTRMEREAFSQLHFSKELCVNSKPEPTRASKQDGLPENTTSSQSCAVCVNYHSVAYDPHRFTVREYSSDLEEKQQQEMKQLSLHKKEQYVSQTSYRLSVEFVCVVLYNKCACLLHRESLCAG